MYENFKSNKYLKLFLIVLFFLISFGIMYPIIKEKNSLILSFFMVVILIDILKIYISSLKNEIVLLSSVVIGVVFFTDILFFLFQESLETIRNTEFEKYLNVLSTFVLLVIIIRIFFKKPKDSVDYLDSKKFKYFLVSLIISSIICLNMIFRPIDISPLNRILIFLLGILIFLFLLLCVSLEIYYSEEEILNKKKLEKEKQKEQKKIEIQKQKEQEIIKNIEQQKKSKKTKLNEKFNDNEKYEFLKKIYLNSKNDWFYLKEENLNIHIDELIIDGYLFCLSSQKVNEIHLYKDRKMKIYFSKEIKEHFKIKKE